MKYVLTGKEMHEADAHAIRHIGIPSLVLMERAAEAVWSEIRGRMKGTPSFLVLTGTGNNGADGLAIARMAFLAGCRVWLLIPKESRTTEEWQIQKRICDRLMIPVTEEWQDADVIVDALFGTGLSRPLEEPFAGLIERANRAPGFRVACDIASGVSAETGAVPGCAFRADLTVTFQYAKVGQLLYPGKEYTGELIVRDIGIPDSGRLAAGNTAFTLTQEDLSALPARPEHSNKGTFGRVLVAAGAKNMCGAALFSAEAAYRTGAGLVEVCTCEENRVIVQTKLPEAVLSTYSPEGAAIPEGSVKAADVLIFGPGMGVNGVTERLLEQVLLVKDKPVILDADGLNVLAKTPERIRELGENVILTPHMKEFSRLTGIGMETLKESAYPAVKEFVKTFAGTLVLKDSATVVAKQGEPLYISTYGNSGMATGGSGDVLTGVIGGLIASRKLSAADGARYGVLLHSLAGDKAASVLGREAVLARDIAEKAEKIIVI